MGPASSDAEPTLRGYSAGTRVFNRYTLVSILGRGGMGVVWRASDETLGEDVALKFLPDAVRWDPGAYDDLKQETRRARQLTHPNIVRIHDFVEDASSAAISMELVEGDTLTGLRLTRANKVMEPADLAPWLPQLAAALDYAHREARVVHRDLKPTNLMLTREGRLKVADFGVARSLADSITRVSMMTAGTMVYMSPQQAMGEDPAPADDVYALGATLYELLTGKPPFHTGDVRLQLFQRKPDSIAARREAFGIEGRVVPAAWEQALAACLAKEPGDRPATVGELVQALQQGAAGSGRRRVRRREGALAAALAAVAGLWVWAPWSRPLAPPAPAPAAPPAPAAVVSFASDETRALAAWNFDGDGRDASGRGFHAIDSRVLGTEDRFGRLDRAVVCNGLAGMEVADRPELRWGGSQPFTAAIWARQDEKPDLSGEVWRSDGMAVGTMIWSLGFTYGQAGALVSRSHHENGVALQGGAVLPMGEWHHLALVSDGSVVRLYANGVETSAAPLGAVQGAAVPQKLEMRFGRPTRHSPWGLVGALDEARLWRRALSPAEVAEVATRDRPPVFALSTGHYGEADEPEAALRAEFGEGVRLADWSDIKRWHANDALGWVQDLQVPEGGLMGWVQRDGTRKFDETRHYFVHRFDGRKPEYYMAHDELGGFTLALGSWYSVTAPLVVALPERPAHREVLAVRGAEPRILHGGRFDLGRQRFALRWRAQVRPAEGEVTTLRLRLADSREWRAVCATIPNAVAVALGPPGGGGVSRNVPASYGEFEFTLIGARGGLGFRAVSAVGRNLLFADHIDAPGFRVGDLVQVELTGGPNSGLATAALVVE